MVFLMYISSETTVFCTFSNFSVSVITNVSHHFWSSFLVIVHFCSVLAQHLKALHIYVRNYKIYNKLVRRGIRNKENDENTMN